MNMIWSLWDENNIEVSSFEGITRLDKQHFEYRFKAPMETLIVHVIQISQLFPRMVDKEEVGI